jgi:ADP-ribosylglycohydrolase/sugar/nucleoside kinase (ribokinase family)
MTNRALGALYGLAIGDALGMPTQSLSRERIAALYGSLTGFEPGPEENEISAGLPAGRVTDDTEQAVIVARAVLDGGGDVDPRALAEALMAWERRMIAAGSLDLLGPSTRRALERFAAGDLEDAGRWGDTNGAAMRIAPVGIATPPRPLERLLERVALTSRLTHGTSVAIAGAAAVAAAVSAGIDGATPDAALALGVEAAARGAAYGHYVAGADVARRIEWALTLTDPGDISALIGTGLATQESVPAAFAIAARHPRDPWQACLTAATLGGDTDTIAAMAGAIVGATTGADAFPPAALERIRTVNPDLDLDALAEALLALRHEAATAAAAEGRAATPHGVASRPAATTSPGTATPPAETTSPAAAPGLAPVVAARRLVHLGSILIDIGVRIPHPPAQGDDMLASSASLVVAGGLNILAAARRQGMPAAYLGRIGAGQFGRMVSAALVAEGVEALLEPAPGEDTGFCVVMVDATGERTMVTTMGAEAHLTEADLAAITLRDDDLVYLSGYDLVYPHGPNVAEWLHGEVLFDPCPLIDEIPPDILETVLGQITWISLNAREAAVLTGSADPRAVLARGPNLRAAIVRDGAEGCRIATAAGVEHIPAFPAEVVDTTGAGDAHVGAFAAALARGESSSRACLYGNAVASVVVANWGPVTAPRLDATERLVSAS